MAKSFSIDRALSDAFGQYCKNWLMLTLAGAIVSSAWLVDHNSVGHLNEVRGFFKHELTQSANAQDAWNKVKDFGHSLGQRQNPARGQYLGLLMWLLVIYLHIGLVRMCMQLTAKGKATFEAFLTGPWDFLKYLGAVSVLSALVIAFTVSMGGLCVLLKWFQLPLSVILMFGFTLLIIFGVYMLHFAFLEYCVVDKAKGVMGVLGCSKEAVAGNLGHLFGFVVIFAIIRALCGIVLHLVASPLAMMIPLPGFGYFLVGSVVTPIVAMGYTSVYRQLK
jgi:hypothetical protein